MSLDDLKYRITKVLDPIELLDLLDIGIEDLVELLTEEIEEKADAVEKACR